MLNPSFLFEADRRQCEPVPCAGTQTYKGWTLVEDDEQDSEGFSTPAYWAVNPDGRCFKLIHSRFSFNPTQDVWIWLVETGFQVGRLDDLAIAAAMHAEDRVAA